METQFKELPSVEDVMDVEILNDESRWL